MNVNIGGLYSMSYSRPGSPLRWFKRGVSPFYVFSHVGNFIEDYGTDYADDPKAFIDLICTILYRETRDKAWVLRVGKTLAQLLNITDEMVSEDKSTNEG